MSHDYWALAVPLGAAGLARDVAGEALANFLWETGATGVVEEGDAAGALGLRAFFPPGADPAELSGRVGAYLEELRGLGIPVGAGPVEVRRLPEEAWAEAWRAHFRPMLVGRRLLVCPPWEAPAVPPTGPAGPRVLVVIEPGRAFGTGSHATTRGCLELLERALDAAPAARVLDVGTGSGILAIAAARLGAPQVRAVDLDPDAVAAAAGNVERNGVGDRVEVELRGLDAVGVGAADLVLANLLGATLVASASALGRGGAPCSRLITGGLLAHEAPAVVGAFVTEGFALVETVEQEGWATLLLARGG